ncbi:MAG: hypothetical protein Q4D73_04120 [Actinomycetaceae bacterium]|nr:hypothetical protein [Actinomycetaceae bacterium]
MSKHSDLEEAQRDLYEAQQDLQQASEDIRAAFQDPAPVSAFSPEATGETVGMTSPGFSPQPYTIPEPPLRKGTNFGLLAWAFVIVTLGILVWTIPFLEKVDPVVLAIVASGSIGFVLLVTAFAVALVERKRNRK